MNNETLLIRLAKRYFWATGRVGRLNFFIRHVLLLTIGISLNEFELRNATSIPEYLQWPMIATILLCFWGMWCNIIQRLHDLGYSSEKLWWCFIPIFNLLVFLYFLFQPGVLSDNQWGPPQDGVKEQASCQGDVLG